MKAVLILCSTAARADATASVVPNTTRVITVTIFRRLRFLGLRRFVGKNWTEGQLELE
jgi:phosphohistidine phosphatase SixA